MLLSEQNLSLVRSRPHQTELYLSIYKPRTVFSAQVNDASIAVGEREITFNNVTTGAWSSIVPGTTLYLGSTIDGKDKGRVRVRGATGTYVLVAENALDWDDDNYIMVKNFHEIWPKFPIIGAEDETIIEYKDYDLPYTDQNTVQGTLVCMGGNYAGFTADSVFYSATGTYNVKGDNLIYLWTFEGAASGTSTAMTPGWVQYDTPGFYVTKLEVTSDSGNVQTSYRHISIYRGLGETYKQWTFEEMSGTRDQGGYTAKITVRDDISDIEEGALVVIFQKSWYGSTEGSIGGNGLNRSGIFFSGYILDGTIEFDYKNNVATFEVGSPSELMKTKETFGISLESVSSASQWYEMDDLTVIKGLWELATWNSTLNETVDIQFMGSDVQTEFFDTDKLPLDGAFNQVLENTIDGEYVCDRQGKIWMERKAEIIASAKSNIDSIMPINKEDWSGIPTIEEVRMNPLSYIEVGGIIYTSATGTSLLYLAAAPGETPGYQGKSDSIPGISIDSKANLLIAAGDVYAHRNRRYPSIDMDLSGNYGVLDIAPLRGVNYYLLAEDNPQKITFDGDLFTVEGMAWAYFSDKKSLLSTLSIGEVTEGYSSTEIAFPIPPELNIPEIPPLDLEILDLEFPTFPPFYYNPGKYNPTPDLQPCADDLANGPFDTYMSGVITSTDYVSKKSGVNNWYVKSGTNPTSYLIDARFQKLVGNAWTDTLEDDFYTFYWVDCQGTRIGEATKDAVGAIGDARTGKWLNFPAGYHQACFLELDMDWDTIRPSTVSITMQEGVTSNYSQFPGTLNYYAYGSSYRIVAQSYRFYSPFGANEDLYIRANIGGFDEFIGQKVTIRQQANVQQVGGSIGISFSQGGTFNAGGGGDIYWKNEYSPRVMSVADDETWTILSVGGGFLWANYEIRANPSGGVPTNYYLTVVTTITPQAQYRIIINKVYVYNVCRIPS